MRDELEILELRNQLKDLEKKLDDMTPKASLACLCKAAPYTAIRYNRETETFYFSKLRTEMWTALREISKTLFLVDRTTTRSDFAVIANHPKKVRDLTPEQQAIAAEFLDEVVNVFNKYFVEINRCIVVDGQEEIVTDAE